MKPKKLEKYIKKSLLLQSRLIYNKCSYMGQVAPPKKYKMNTLYFKNGFAVTITNGNISVNPFDFKIQDSNGAIEEIASPTYFLDDQFESAELASGGVRSGSVVFEVPKNDSNLKFIYEPSFWSNKKVQVKL